MSAKSSKHPPAFKNPDQRHSQHTACSKLLPNGQNVYICSTLLGLWECYKWRQTKNRRDKWHFLFTPLRPPALLHSHISHVLCVISSPFFKEFCFVCVERRPRFLLHLFFSFTQKIISVLWFCNGFMSLIGLPKSILCLVLLKLSCCNMFLLYVLLL